MGKTTEKLIHDNRSQSRDLKPGPPTYEAREQLTRPRRLPHLLQRNYKPRYHTGHFSKRLPTRTV